MLEGSQPRVWFVFVTKEGKSLVYFCEEYPLWKSCEDGGVGGEETLVQVSLCVLKTLHQLRSLFLRSCLSSLRPAPSPVPPPLLLSSSPFDGSSSSSSQEEGQPTAIRCYTSLWMLVNPRESPWIPVNPHSFPLNPTQPLSLSPPHPSPPTPVKVLTIWFFKREFKDIYIHMYGYTCKYVCIKRRL